jgi:hypothetical protein
MSAGPYFYKKKQGIQVYSVAVYSSIQRPPEGYTDGIQTVYSGIQEGGIQQYTGYTAVYRPSDGTPVYPGIQQGHLPSGVSFGDPL